MSTKYNYCCKQTPALYHYNIKIWIIYLFILIIYNTLHKNKNKIINLKNAIQLDDVKTCIPLKYHLNENKNVNQGIYCEHQGGREGGAGHLARYVSGNTIMHVIVAKIFLLDPSLNHINKSELILSISFF